MRYQWLLSVATVTLLLFFWRAWLLQTHERESFKIMAPQGVESTQPVYAQFVYTQSFVAPYSQHTTRLQVPVYANQSGQTLQVRLLQHGATLHEWHVRVPNVGITMMDLPFNPPRTLEGPLELELSSREIDAREEARALRVFIEKADYAYPEGNYRVADNAKSGDIAFSMYEQVSNRQAWQEKFRETPLFVAGKIGTQILRLMIIAILPVMLWRMFFALHRQQ